MTIIYRNNDPVSGRWSGIGANLSAFQIDSNFYECVSRIVTLENNESFTVSISYITQTADMFTFHMTDHTLQGPFTIPQSTFVDRGTWQPSTAYVVNDTFNVNGTLYLVIFDHTSASTFSAGANDGSGHNFYSAMISVPGSALPTGGAVTQVLQKSSSTDFAVTWGYKLPTGGTTSQILAKVSNTNQDVNWEDFPGVLPPPPSPAGIPGQILATVDGTHTSMEWVNPSGSDKVTAPPPSPPASPGQLLSTVDGTSINTVWVDPATVVTIIDVIEFVIDGGGSVITTGMKGYLSIPYACTITKATLLGDQSGSIVVNVWKCSYGDFDAGSTHPVSGDAITASTPPTISSGVKSQNAGLSGWTTAIVAQDVLAFNVDSITTMQRVTIALETTR